LTLSNKLWGASRLSLWAVTSVVLAPLAEGSAENTPRTTATDKAPAKAALNQRRWSTEGLVSSKEDGMSFCSRPSSSAAIAKSLAPSLVKEAIASTTPLCSYF